MSLQPQISPFARKQAFTLYKTSTRTRLPLTQEAGTEQYTKQSKDFISTCTKGIKKPKIHALPNILHHTSQCGVLDKSSLTSSTFNGVFRGNVKPTTLENIYFKINFQVHKLPKKIKKVKKEKKYHSVK